MNTNTALTTRETKASALATMASRFSVDPTKLLATLKSTVFKGASDDECMALVIVANEFNLNPFKKEIYAFPAKGGGITPVVGVDGWIRLMNQHESFDGIEFEFSEKDGKPVSCTAIIHSKGRRVPLRVTEYLSECERNTDAWKQMPRRMLRNRAICQAVRIAFSVGGIIDEDEAEQMLDPVKTAKPVFASPSAQLPEPPAEPKRKSKEPAPAVSAKTILSDWMTAHQFTWGQIQPILVAEQVLPEADSIPSADDLTEAQAAKVHAARAGIEAVIEAVAK